MNLSAHAFPAILFCPADRPDRFHKALERADSVILDLEDAVLHDSKALARQAIIDSDLPADRVIVRINSPKTGDFGADLAAIAQTEYRNIMVAKASSADLLATLPSTYKVIALCETAAGVKSAEAIAALENVVGLMWGAEDLIASMGGTSSRNSLGQYRDIARYARAEVLLAARAAGKFAIDAVHVDIDDVEGLKAEAEDASASGFQGTACIHPGQVATVREAYRPTLEEIKFATALLNAAESKPGVFNYEGKMVDEPVLRHARSIVNRERIARERLGK